MYITGNAMGINGTAKRNTRRPNVVATIRANAAKPRLDAVDAACLAIASLMLATSIVAGFMFGIVI